MGRPTRLTPEVMLNICNAIKAGNYIEIAAGYVGVPRVTLHEWLKKGAKAKSGIYKDFHNSLGQAWCESEARDVLVVTNAANSGNWGAAAWRLERKFRERWGRPASGVLSTQDGVPSDAQPILAVSKETLALAGAVARALESITLQIDSQPAERPPAISGPV